MIELMDEPFIEASETEIAKDGLITGLMGKTSHLSYSSLSQFKDSPKDFISYKLQKKEQTDAMAYGNLVHCLVLEPDLFEKRYFPIDDTTVCEEIGGAKPRGTNKYRDWKAQQILNAGKRIIVKTDDFINAQIAADAVKFNRASAMVLHKCPQHEHRIEWEYENFLFKGFIDGLGDKVIFDLKTVADASPKKVQRDILNMSYYLQAAMYVFAKGGVYDYNIVAVDKMGGVSVHKLENHLLQHGMVEYASLMKKFNDCILNDSWDQSYDFYSDRFDGSFICEKPTWLY